MSVSIFALLFGLPPLPDNSKKFCTVIGIGAGIAIAGAVGAAGSIFGGLFGSSGGDDAAAAAAIASETALKLDKRARADLQPFRDVGIQAKDSLSSLLFGGGTTENFLKSSDLFQFQLEEGTEAINRNLSARGLFGSGAGVETLTDFTRGLVAEEGQRTFDRLFNLTTLGANAAARQATGTTQTGNTLASLQTQAGIAQANINAGQQARFGSSIASAGANVGGAFALNSLLQRIDRSGGGPGLDLRQNFIPGQGGLTTTGTQQFQQVSFPTFAGS